MKQIYDVIVVGGGPAGIMSAMACGRLGVSTLLIEKNGFLGGAATASVLGPICLLYTSELSGSGCMCGKEEIPHPGLEFSVAVWAKIGRVLIIGSC